MDLGLRELYQRIDEKGLGVVWALQIYEHLIIGSKFPITIYTDHKPILYLWGKKGQCTHRFFKYQKQFLKFNNIVIKWKQGKDLTFPDLLSRNATSSKVKELQLQHKVLPKEIKFFAKDGDPVLYFIEHDGEKPLSNKDPHLSYPIIKKKGNSHYRIRIDGKTGAFTEQPISDLNISTLANINIIMNDPKTLEYITPYEDLDELSQNQLTVTNLHLNENTIPPDSLLHFIHSDLWTDQLDDTSDITSFTYDTHDTFPYLDPELFIHLCIGDKENIKHLEIQPELLLQEQKLDPCLKHVRSWVKNNQLPPTQYHKMHKLLNKMADDFELFRIDQETDLLLKSVPVENSPSNQLAEYRICLPVSLILTVFNEAHKDINAGHPGIQKTIDRIQTFFYFPGLYVWIKYLIKDCIDCQTKKNIVKTKSQTAKMLAPSLHITAPMQAIHIDYKGPIQPTSNGKSYILVIVDSFTNYVFAAAVPAADSHNTIIHLEEFLNIFGTPDVLISDRGTHFMNRDFVNFCQGRGIKNKFLSGYNPQANGKVETLNSHLGAYLRIVASKPNTWSKYIKNWCFAHNTCNTIETGITPHELMFGRKPV